MTERVKRLLGLAPKQTGNKLIINSEKLERRVALLENGVLEEYSIERQTDRNIVGSIFKGRVKNIEHGLKAMFVDIGFEKNAFLHFWDALPAALDSGIEEVDRPTGGKKDKKRITAKDIPSIYPVGSEVLVQVTKGPISTKGPRITTNLSLAGRYLVLMPYSDQSGISRKIEQPKERERLRKILKELDVPEGMGVIVRTVGEGQRARYFVRDLGLLVEQWRAIEDAMKTKPAACCVFEEPDLIERTVRDFLTDEIDEVVCDDEGAVKCMTELVGQISKRSASRIKFYTESQPLFEKYGVQKQIDDAFHRQVWLPCGGYIVIDETEALIAIDVNTGRNKGGKDVEKTILQTNLEAADEMARQMRLRNIGGLIIGDFIDMKSRKDQQSVYQRMKDRLKRDKSKTHVLPISPLGLMEMTRQRAMESISGAVYDSCPYCHGRGKVKSAMTMSVELQRALHLIMRNYQDTVHEVKVVVHPHVLSRLRSEDEELLVEIERKYAGRLTFRADPSFHHEKFTILDALTNQELKH
ncbi:MAG: rnaseeg: ribonuclease rne/rng family [Chthoniobacteraceae bacterium]|nr:rnaseeg: ribonuclease rne/rng family [Chthoniobacteraceae bacterium]MDB6172211.1 rnaseeg: ribonuclease rne/rng family [Chthoniobacteraceae bacterium]